MALALSSIDMAKMAVSNSSSSYIVLEVENNGSSIRWTSQFPSLTSEQLEALSTQNTTFLEYETRNEAVSAFETLTRDCADESMGQIVTGTITFVSLPYDQDDGHDVVSWELDDESRAVWKVREWKHEMIADRI